MKKIVTLSLVLISSLSLLTAQTHRLSNDQNESRALPEQPQQGIKANATQQFVLNPDGTWQFEDGSYSIVKASNNEKYALFSSGKWSPMETLTDGDGNTYDAVKIGNYFWMTKNMQTTKYSNGQPIKLSPDNNADWKSKAGAYTNIDNKIENKAEKGLLYSWHVANNPYRICPKGWRIPSDDEWMDLFTTLGGISNAGVPLKSTQGWKPKEEVTSNPNGTDMFMFNGVPTGYRQMHNENSAFWHLKSEATYWSITTKSDNDATAVTINTLSTLRVGPSPKFFGRSIRCIK
ncbi:MAG: fibrobacter succinogenes major paralogous domain-containing protein [Salinivirgaceae bacterium]|nr:fibrobacter succinogenes major paralogous domain-containing protein [Salinivirgaceae bacterium]MDY0280503.1 fibrobacter succinogenes major paralogous domain-containing protein [Salinivirgaceae bacterium]